MAWEPIALSRDHDLDTNPEERQRLLREHPDEDDVLGRADDPRVKGLLQPTRCFGDGLFKRMEYFHALDYRQRASLLGWNPPYITARPDVVQHRLTAEDEFLVMGTDGLFADMSNQEVVDCVGEYIAAVRAARPMKSFEPTVPSNVRSDAASKPAPVVIHPYGPPASLTDLSASAFLLRRALANAGRNLCRSSDTEEDHGLSVTLSIPAGHRRRFHDDITVLVIWFDSAAIAARERDQQGGAVPLAKL